MSPIRKLIRTAGFEKLHQGTWHFVKRQVLRMPTVGVFAAVFDEQNRILLVRQSYRQDRWALPGGRFETGETVSAAVVREVREETGYLTRVEHLIGIYSLPSKDDMILFFRARIESESAWTPGLEIAERRFFARDELPEHLGSFDRERITHAFEGRREVIHDFL